MHITLTLRSSLAMGVAAVVAISACSGKSSQTASGTVDTASLRTGADVPAEGLGVHVTRTDAKSVDKSTEFKLTDDNFAKFVVANDSIDALANRDSAFRAFITTDLTDAGSTTQDAGLRWIESNASMLNAITASGLSSRDYYVAAIAIAAAERFIDNPKAAPPTPTTRPNAEFLGTHRTDLAHLQALRMGRPVVIVKP